MNCKIKISFKFVASRQYQFSSRFSVHWERSTAASSSCALADPSRAQGAEATTQSGTWRASVRTARYNTGPWGIRVPCWTCGRVWKNLRINKFRKTFREKVEHFPFSRTNQAKPDVAFFSRQRSPKLCACGTDLSRLTEEERALHPKTAGSDLYFLSFVN